MSVYALSDTHLSLDGSKPMDIFRGWENYVERLRYNWNTVVSENDTVVIPGDISWGMTLAQARPDLEFIHKELKGKKIILKGNHDYWWATQSKMNSFLNENGFDSITILNNDAYLAEDICVVGTRGWINDGTDEFDTKVLKREEGRLRMSVERGLKLGGELTAFIHYPPIFAGEKNEYILKVIKEYGVKRCYYGHVHGASGHAKAFQGEYDGTEFKMISADYLGFMPVRIGGTDNTAKRI